MTKIMNICDSVTTSTIRGRRPHFLDALIEEKILYFTIIWDFFTTIPPLMFPTKVVRTLIKIHQN
jgi:hypothetical protein